MEQQQKKTLGKWVKITLGSLFLMLIIVIGLTVGALYWAHKHGDLHQWIEEALQAKIEYKTFSVHWTGVSPQITLKDVTVAAPSDKQQALTLKSASIRLDLIASLIHFSPIASSVSLKGLTAKIVQTVSGSYQLAGFTGSNDQQKVSWQLVGPWLQNQDNVHMRDTKVVIYRYHAKPVIFSGVDVLWQRVNADQHFLSATSNIVGGQHGEFTLQSKIIGNISEPHDLRVLFYGSIQADNWAGLIEGKSWQHISLQSGTGKVRVWGEWTTGRLQHVHIVTQLQNLKLHNADLNFTLLMKYLDENIAWRRQDHNWSLVMDRLTTAPVQSLARRNQIAVHYRLVSGQKQWSIAFRQVDLPLLSHVAIMLPQLSKHLKHTIVALSPAGVVEHFEAQVLLHKGQVKAYRVSGTVNQLSYHSVGDIPGSSGLNGQFEIGSKAGFVTLSGKRVQFSPSKLFFKPLPTVSLKLNVHWIHTAKKIDIQLYHLDVLSPNINWHTQGQIQVSVHHWRQADVNLASYYTIKNLQQILPNILPDSAITPKFKRWVLNTIHSAPLIEGQWVWRGQLNTFPYLQHQGVFQIGLAAQHIGLAPGHGWPVVHNMQLTMLFDAPSFNVLAQNGEAYGVQVTSVKASMADLIKHSPLKVNILAHADAADAMEYMLHSPLASQFGELKHWVALSGQVKAKAHLVMIHDDRQADKHYGTITLKNVSLHLPMKLHVGDVNGVINFDNTVLSSDQLQGEFTGHPLLMHLGTSSPSNDITDLYNTFTAKGVFNMKAINAQLPSAFNVIRGQVPFNFQFSWHKKQGLITLSSDGIGLGLKLPAPFYKAPETRMPLKLIAKINRQSLISFQVGSMFTGRVQMTHKKYLHRVKKAAIAVGMAKLPALPKASDIKITGIVSYVSLKDWQRLFHRWLTHKPKSKVALLPRKTKLIIPWSRLYASIHVGTMAAFGQQLNNMHISLSQAGKQWQVGLESKVMLGTVMLPTNWYKPYYIADFDYLTLPHDQHKVKLTGFTAMKMHRWPAIDFSAQHLQLGSHQFGEVEWSSQPLPNGILISNFEISNKDLKAALHGSVTHANRRQDKVVVIGTFKGANWGSALAALGYPDLMINGKGDVNVDLSWLGRVQKPILKTLDGEASFNLQDGSFSKVNPGLMKMLGIFNIVGFIKQASSSFFGFSKGLTFNSLKGSYIIKNSIASTKSVHLTGQAVDLILRGDINLKTHALDQTIVMIPHLSGGIALVAGIIGGPIVGVATWLGEKIIGNTILRNKGFIFYVRGTWDKPIISHAKSTQ